jgi:polar amino acid transport system substrate-binding protein
LFSMLPYNFNLPKYDFSDPFLKTGPVLVVRYDSKIDSLNNLDGKEIAVQRGSSDANILEKYPNILIRIYDSLPEVFNAINAGSLDGAIAPSLLAESYTKDLYNKKLKVATPHLNDDGLRLITLNGKSTPLRDSFNRGLKNLKSNGTYDKLAQKWGLSN